jgi:hypothetical protein
MPPSAPTPAATSTLAPPVLPAPHNVFRRQFLRFPDHGGSLGIRLVVSATHVVVMNGKPVESASRV